MDSNIVLKKPDFSGNGSEDTQDATRGPRPDREQIEQDGSHAENEKGLHETRKESVATAVEEDSAISKMTPMDNIETAHKDSRNDSDDHTVHMKETVKEAAHSAKKKLYLHHRHDRKLSKHFTPGSAPSHYKPHDDTEAQLERSTSVSPTVWQNIKIMFTTFPYWNMAFWSGWCYSIGSALFIIDGAWTWVPLQWPGTEFHGQEEYGVPLLFFFGACLYQVGGVMAYLEAVNDGCFAGAAMKRLLEGHQDIEKELLDAKLHVFFGHIVPHHHSDDEDNEDEDHHHHSEKPQSNWESLTKDKTPESVYDEAKDRVERRGGVDVGPTKEGQVREYLTWRWWPTWHALKTYHIFELGYVACAIQLFGVTLYGVTSVVILPGILSSLEWWQELGAYWVPQVVASCCFLIASIMFTIMAQEKWYRPKIGAVSWWIGIWAQLGSVGFLLCAIFGLYSNDHTWGEYQSSLSSMWGSFFYMTSGLFQWYEAINVNVGPVLAFPNNRTPVLLRKNPQ